MWLYQQENSFSSPVTTRKINGSCNELKELYDHITYRKVLEVRTIFDFDAIHGKSDKIKFIHGRDKILEGITSKEWQYKNYKQFRWVK